MEFPALIRGHFVRRDNRFRATVRVDGRETWAHVPNSGRLTDLFLPEQPVWLAPSTRPNRKTRYDLKLVECATGLVSVDARLPGPLFAEALAAGQVRDLDFHAVRREVIYRDSRLDFCLTSANGVCWVETKSVTLVEDGVALFPDVPTERGRRHLLVLKEASAAGHRALVVFVVQRPDARCLTPHAAADPAFSTTLCEAVEAGVEARAYTCQVSQERIAIAAEIPVVLA